MCKNAILSAAVRTTLALPRHTVWVATALAVTCSLDAGLSISGDHLGVIVGTPQV
jgi:hypothetical protein